MIEKLAAILAAGIPALLVMTVPHALVAQSENAKTTAKPAAKAQPQEQKPQTTRRRKTTPRRRDQSTTTAVHKAWLNEIVDLDREAAIETYDAILKESPKGRPERWLAVGRLRELDRLGVLTPEPVSTPGQEPAAVKKALDLLRSPFPFADVLAVPDSGNELPALRPATPSIQSWVRDQIGLTVRERFSPAFRQRNTRSRSSSSDRHWYVVDIMRREVEGNRPQANALRELWFPTWKPPTVEGDRTKVLAEARRRMTEWIGEETSSRRREELRMLEKAIQTQAGAGDNPAQATNNAVELIRRLPYYAPRLLGPVKKTEDTKKPK